MPPASPPLVSTAMLEGAGAEGAVAVSVMKQVKDPGPVRSILLRRPSVHLAHLKGPAYGRCQYEGRRSDKAAAGESGGRPTKFMVLSCALTDLHLEAWTGAE